MIIIFFGFTFLAMLVLCCLFSRHFLFDTLYNYCFNSKYVSDRRQSLDNLLGPTGEKVKEIFTHGMMMLNITSLTERRNSEPKAGITEDKGKCSGKKLPSPLEKTLTYLNIEDDNSDTESLSRYHNSIFVYKIIFLIIHLFLLTQRGYA